MNSHRLRAGIWFACCAAAVAIPCSALFQHSLEDFLILVLCPIATSGLTGAIWGAAICNSSVKEHDAIKRGAIIASLSWLALGVLSSLFLPGEGENASRVRAISGFMMISVVALPLLAFAGMISAKLLQIYCKKRGITNPL